MCGNVCFSLSLLVKGGHRHEWRDGHQRDLIPAERNFNENLSAFIYLSHSVQTV
jgi:hypothetical protein